MLFVRSLLFNIYFLLWTASLSFFASPLLFFPTRIVAKIGYVWAVGVNFGLRYICNIKYEIIGSENLPPEPFVVASKHQSAWDTAIFLQILNKPSYILKKELLKIPFFGSYLVAMDMIPVDRQGGAAAIKKLQADANDRLAKKQSIVIFPEGTRTLPEENLTYQPGIAFIYMALDKNIPVVPVALNSGLFWNKKSFLRPAGTIKLQYLPPITAGKNRKEFMEELQGVIEGKTKELYN